MQRQGSGSIITLASQLAIAGGRNNSAYIAAKGAIVSLTRTMALDFAMDGIRVNAIAPGAIDTPMLQRSFARHADPEPVREASRNRHAMKRFGKAEEVAEAVRLLSQAGFQVHFHALGDRAVHVALDALAGAGTAADLRHHLAHLQFIRPADLDRFRDLGAVANFQPLWACHDPQMDDLTLPVVGPERAGWQYRIGTLARRGTRLAFGSDWPVSSADPLQEIHVAVNRRLSPRLGQPGTAETDRPFLPDEAVTVSQALTAFTAGVAYVNHREADLGSLRPGHLADIAVLDRDILAISAAEIGSAQVDLTIAGGQVVHGDE